MMLAFVFAVCFTGCKDSKDETSAPYDPNQPVEVTDFTPKSGGGKKKMIIYGSNFGTDPSLVSVKVGGKEAIVISAKGTSIYCSTPESCFEGTIEVKVGEQTVIASEKYQYEPQMVVTDLCGDVDELGEGNWNERGVYYLALCTVFTAGRKSGRKRATVGLVRLGKNADCRNLGRTTGIVREK